MFGKESDARIPSCVGYLGGEGRKPDGRGDLSDQEKPWETRGA